MSDLNPNSFRRLMVQNIALPLLVGLLSSAIFIFLILQLISANHRADQTDQVILRANENLKLLIDAETGLRGFVITGNSDFLEPNKKARAIIPTEMAELRTLVSDNPSQVGRIDSVTKLYQSWLEFFEHAKSLKEKKQDAGAYISSGIGKRLTDQLRDEFEQFIKVEIILRTERTESKDGSAKLLLTIVVIFSLFSSALIAFMGRQQLLQLSKSYENALLTQVNQNQTLERQAWIRTAQTELSDKMMGEQSLPALSGAILQYLAKYLNASVGVLFVATGEQDFARTATHAFSDGSSAPEKFKLGEGALGQAVSEKRVTVVSDLPPNYLKVASALGDTSSQTVLIAPFVSDGAVNSVIELGFIRSIDDRAYELVEQVSESVSAAFKSAKYRDHLERVLKEVQTQSEELQAQQEELRVTNEELEEQHTELEQTNSQLEEQTRALEMQKDLLDQRNDALTEAQESLVEKASELEKSSRYKSEFLANMSHELRTPLNSSLILAKLLADNKEENLTKQQIEFALQISASGNDLLTLINDILDLSKVESGKLDITPEEIKIPKFLTHLEQTFIPVAKEKNLRLTFSSPSDTPEFIFSDRFRLEQVLKNLLSNALKFTNEGGVSLSVSAAGEWIRFDVKDTGIGILPEQYEVIFEAFRQADGTTNRKYGGTGLGLSISKDLARLLGGKIEVESESGIGSTFSLILPKQYESSNVELSPAKAVMSKSKTERTREIDEARPIKTTAPKAPRPQAAIQDDRDDIQPNDKTLLIVEDDPQFEKILFDLAHEQGFKCFVAAGAEEGIELAIDHVPQAILLDMKLPDHNGLFVLDQLKQNPKTRHIPVHVVSGYDFSRQALQMGAIGFMLKPAKRDKLIEALNRLENKMSQEIRHVLIVEDDRIQREAIQLLIEDSRIKTTVVESGTAALRELAEHSFDCMILDLHLPDMSGFELLDRMGESEAHSYPPVIVYTGRDLSREEAERLSKRSQSVIVKGARSPERLLDEVTLFLHRVESQLPKKQRLIIENLRNREKHFESKSIMIVDDDMRNVFALTAALEQKGAKIIVAKNGEEALKKLGEDGGVDVVLMDIMMPIMNGYEAMREIRKLAHFKNLPIIALTAKAMKDDRELCLASGANDYLSKPVDLEKLLSLIRVWLPSSKARS